jgi:multiple antibiotic resistance protein
MLLPHTSGSVPSLVREMGVQAVLAFTALLPLVNPLGSALILLGIVGPAPPEVYCRMARKVAIFTFIFLLAIQLLGEALLRFFGLSLEVVQLAGGLVVASIGWNLLNRAEPATTEKQLTPAVDFGSLEKRMFYPLTFPLTAGPGCLVLMLTLGAHAERRSVTADLFVQAGTTLAVIAMCVLVYFSYRYAERLTRRVSQQTVHGFLRIMGFIVLSIGVQIAWNGLAALVRGEFPRLGS